MVNAVNPPGEQVTGRRPCSSRALRVALASILTIVQCWFPIAQAQSADATPPASIDIEPPVIELEETTSGIAGESQVFTALVIDNQALKDVKLYYRYTGQGPFNSVLMQPLSDTGYFTAKIPTARLETRSIEYYLQARDQNGNRVVNGYAFDPLVRKLTTQQRPQPQIVTAPVDTPPPSNENNQSGGIKWWHIALGVLAAGALAGLSSDGGDDGNNPGTGNSVPITLTATPPN